MSITEDARRQVVNIMDIDKAIELVNSELNRFTSTLPKTIDISCLTDEDKMFLYIHHLNKDKKVGALSDKKLMAGKSPVIEMSREDFVDKVRHKLLLNKRGLNYYNSVFYLVSYIGSLRNDAVVPDHDDYGDEIDVLTDYFSNNSKGVYYTADIYDVFTELFNWCYKKGLSIRNLLTSVNVEETFEAYIEDVLQKGIINWNKPASDAFYKVCSNEDLMQYIIDYVHKVNGVKGKPGERIALDCISRHKPEHLSPVSNIDIYGIDKDILTVISMVLGKQKVDGSTSVETVLYYTAYWSSSPEFYTDYELDKTRVRL